MASKQALMQASLPPLAADQLGADPPVTVSSLPATTTSNFLNVTASSGTLTLGSAFDTFFITSTGTITVVPPTGMTINGATSLTVSGGQAVLLVPSGTTFFALAGSAT